MRTGVFISFSRRKLYWSLNVMGVFQQTYVHYILCIITRSFHLVCFHSYIVLDVNRPTTSIFLLKQKFLWLESHSTSSISRSIIEALHTYKSDNYLMNKYVIAVKTNYEYIIILRIQYGRKKYGWEILSSQNIFKSMIISIKKNRQDAPTEYGLAADNHWIFYRRQT